MDWAGPKDATRAGRRAGRETKEAVRSERYGGSSNGGWPGCKWRLTGRRTSASGQMRDGAKDSGPSMMEPAASWSERRMIGRKGGEDEVEVEMDDGDDEGAAGRLCFSGGWDGEGEAGLQCMANGEWRTAALRGMRGQGSAGARPGAARQDAPGRAKASQAKRAMTSPAVAAKPALAIRQRPLVSLLPLEHPPGDPGLTRETRPLRAVGEDHAAPIIPLLAGH